MVEEVNITDADFERVGGHMVTQVVRQQQAQTPQYYKINAYPQNIIRMLSKGGCFKNMPQAL